MEINMLDLTIEELRAIAADGRLILASREELESGQAAIAELAAAKAEWSEVVRDQMDGDAAIKKSIEKNTDGKLNGGIYATIANALDAATARAEAAEAQLEFDRTTCHNFIKALDVALDGRFWLTEGRGSYSWDDDRYRTEFHDAAVSLRAIIDPMRKMAQNLASRLPTTEAVMKARVDVEARAEAAEANATAQAAHIGELRGALEKVGEGLHAHCNEHDEECCRICIGEEIAAALAETPSASLARCKAAALRELIEEADKQRGGIISTWGDVSAGDILGIAVAMADRLEAEAAGATAGGEQ